MSTSGRCQQMAGDGGKDGGGSSGQGQGAWKLDVARQVLVEDYGPRLDWVAVAKALDHDRFNIPDQVHTVRETGILWGLCTLYRGVTLGWMWSVRCCAWARASPCVPSWYDHLQYCRLDVLRPLRGVTRTHAPEMFSRRHQDTYQEFLSSILLFPRQTSPGGRGVNGRTPPPPKTHV